jgi:hypothetical protein
MVKHHVLDHNVRSQVLHRKPCAIICLQFDYYMSFAAKWVSFDKERCKVNHKGIREIRACMKQQLSAAGFWQCPFPCALPSVKSDLTFCFKKFPVIPCWVSLENNAQL